MLYQNSVLGFGLHTCTRLCATESTQLWERILVQDNPIVEPRIHHPCAVTNSSPYRKSWSLCDHSRWIRPAVAYTWSYSTSSAIVYNELTPLYYQDTVHVLPYWSVHHALHRVVAVMSAETDTVPSSFHSNREMTILTTTQLEGSSFSRCRKQHSKRPP